MFCIPPLGSGLVDQRVIPEKCLLVPQQVLSSERGDDAEHESLLLAVGDQVEHFLRGNFHCVHGVPFSSLHTVFSLRKI